MTTNAIVAVCVVGTALVGVGMMVAKAVNTFAAKIEELKEAMSQLRLEIEKGRSEDRLEVRSLITEAIKECRQSCQLLRRELTENP
jgi:cell division protein FtsX